MTPDQLRALQRRPRGRYSNRLNAAIEITGTVVARMSEETGLSQQYISDVRRSRYGDILVQRAHVFADYFGCLIEDLFPRVDEPARDATARGPPNTKTDDAAA